MKGYQLLPNVQIFAKDNNRVEPIGRNQWAQGVKQKETIGTKNSLS
jgi:hypothetical protein